MSASERSAAASWSTVGIVDGSRSYCSLSDAEHPPALATRALLERTQVDHGLVVRRGVGRLGAHRRSVPKPENPDKHLRPPSPVGGAATFRAVPGRPTVPDSPLLPFVEPDRGTAAFSVGVPAGATLDDIGPRVLAGAPRSTSRRRRACPRPATRRNAHDGIGFRTRLRARVLHLRAGHVVGGPRAARPARRLVGRSSTWWPTRWPSAPTCRSPGCSSAPPTPTPGPGQFLGTRLLQPLRLEPPRLRPRLDPVPRRARSPAR